MAKVVITNGRGTNVLGMDPADLKRRVDKASEHLREIEALFPGLVELSDDERIHSNGRLRDGEPKAMRAVLDAADARPGVFASLAPRDHGTDDATFETAPTREALDRRDPLATLSDSLAALSRRVDDTVLKLGSDAREVTVPAYGILRANAPIDATLRSKGAAALSFFGGAARKRAAKVRRAQKSKKAANQ